MSPLKALQGAFQVGYLVIVGSERAGVTQALLDVSDVALRIPMFGRKSSLNLAAACAIAVFELTKNFERA